MEGSKRTTTCIRHLSSSTKNQAKTKKIPLYDRKFVVNNTSNHFKFIMTPTSGKTCGLHCKNGAITLPSQKPMTVDNMLL